MEGERGRERERRSDQTLTLHPTPGDPLQHNLSPTPATPAFEMQHAQRQTRHCTQVANTFCEPDPTPSFPQCLPLKSNPPPHALRIFFAFFISGPYLTLLISSHVMLPSPYIPHPQPCTPHRAPSSFPPSFCGSLSLALSLPCPLFLTRIPMLSSMVGQ